jgi:membrane-associated phospholipid phosphatase
MFQTEIIIFIQSFANEFWTFLFSMFSEIGRSNVVIPLIIVITVGFHFRIGIVLMHTAFWSGMFANIFKEVFQLPRPANVDKAVQLLGKDYANPTTFEGQGGQGFFGGLPRQVVEYLRAHRIDGYGFPSGHTSLAVGFWGSLFFFFKQKWLRVTAVVFLVAIPFSRMYLGRHFLVDVLGGYLLGAVVLLFFYKDVYKNPVLHRYLFEQLMALRVRLKDILVFTYLLGTPFLLMLVPLDSLETEKNTVYPAILLGMNLAFLLLWKRGLPKESGTFKQRSLRVILGVFVFMATRLLLKTLSGLAFEEEPHVILFFRQVLTFFITFGGGIELAIKLKLFEREVSQS